MTMPGTEIRKNDRGSLSTDGEGVQCSSTDGFPGPLAGVEDGIPRCKLALKGIHRSARYKRRILSWPKKGLRGR